MAIICPGRSSPVGIECNGRMLSLVCIPVTEALSTRSCLDKSKGARDLLNVIQLSL